jgi:hypothetical protein
MRRPSTAVYVAEIIDYPGLAQLRDNNEQVCEQCGSGCATVDCIHSATTDFQSIEVCTLKVNIKVSQVQVCLVYIKESARIFQTVETTRSKTLGCNLTIGWLHLLLNEGFACWLERNELELELHMHGMSDGMDAKSCSRLHVTNWSLVGKY